MASITSAAIQLPPRKQKTASRKQVPKCIQCAHPKVKQECNPKNRQWPGQKCDRCQERGLPCSAPMTSKERRMVSGEEAQHLHSNVLPGTPLSMRSTSSDPDGASGSQRHPEYTYSNSMANGQATYASPRKSSPGDSSSDFMELSPDTAHTAAADWEPAGLDLRLSLDPKCPPWPDRQTVSESMGKRPASNTSLHSVRPRKLQAVNNHTHEPESESRLRLHPERSPVTQLSTRHKPDPFAKAERLDESIRPHRSRSLSGDNGMAKVNSIPTSDFPTSAALNMVEYLSLRSSQRLLLQAELRAVFGDQTWAHQLYASVCRAELKASNQSPQLALRLISACARTETWHSPYIWQSQLAELIALVQAKPGTTVNGVALQALQTYQGSLVDSNAFTIPHVRSQKDQYKARWLRDMRLTFKALRALPPEARNRCDLLSYRCIIYPQYHLFDDELREELSESHDGVHIYSLMDDLLSGSNLLSRMPSIHEVVRVCRDVLDEQVSTTFVDFACESLPYWVYLHAFARLWSELSSLQPSDSRLGKLKEFEYSAGISSVEVLAVVCWMMLDQGRLAEDGFKAWCESTLHLMEQVPIKSKADRLWKHTQHRMRLGAVYLFRSGETSLKLQFIKYLTEKPRPFSPMGICPHTLSTRWGVDKFISHALGKPVNKRRESASDPAVPRTHSELPTRTKPPELNQLQVNGEDHKGLASNAAVLTIPTTAPVQQKSAASRLSSSTLPVGAKEIEIRRSTPPRDPSIRSSKASTMSWSSIQSVGIRDSGIRQSIPLRDPSIRSSKSSIMSWSSMPSRASWASSLHTLDEMDVIGEASENAIYDLVGEAVVLPRR